MIREGQVVLFRFPATDLVEGKLRPALIVRKLPGPYDDWLVCMISSQVDQAIEGFDEVIGAGDSDFVMSGLKTESVVRLSRLATVERKTFLGAIGQIDPDRLRRIRDSLSGWIMGV